MTSHGFRAARGIGNLNGIGCPQFPPDSPTIEARNTARPSGPHSGYPPRRRDLQRCTTKPPDGYGLARPAIRGNLVFAEHFLYMTNEFEGSLMSDDKSNRGSPDRDRIDIHDPNELRYWTKALHVSPEKLKEVVGQVGTSVKKVRSELGQ